MKLVLIQNNQNWNRHYPKQNVCFGCFASIPKQRVSVFRLNRTIKFCVVLGSFGLFQFVSVSFETVCFSCFKFYTETASFDVSIEPKQTKDQPKQFDRKHIFVFFRQFRVVLV